MVFDVVECSEYYSINRKSPYNGGTKSSKEVRGAILPIYHSECIFNAHSLFLLVSLDDSLDYINGVTTKPADSSC